MDPRAISGDQLVLGVIVATVTMSLRFLSEFVYVLRDTTNIHLLGVALALSIPAVGILLTAGLGVFVYRRAKWARWVAGAFLGLQSASYVAVGIYALARFGSVASSEGHAGQTALFYVAMGLLYLACALVLLLAPAVRAYFNEERAVAA